MKSLNSKSGFTLIEALISILILAIVIMAGMKLFFVTDEIKTLAMHKKLATELASSKLEELKEAGYNDPKLDTGTHGPEDTTLGQLLASSGDGLGLSYTVEELEDEDGLSTDGDADYKKVIVSVKWKEANHNDIRNVQFETLIAP